MAAKKKPKPIASVKREVKNTRKAKQAVKKKVKRPKPKSDLSKMLRAAGDPADAKIDFAKIDFAKIEQRMLASMSSEQVKKMRNAVAPPTLAELLSNSRKS